MTGTATPSATPGPSSASWPTSEKRHDQKTPECDPPSPEHQRRDGVDDVTVTAFGSLSEALKAVEEARGHLYAFHRMTGHGDLTLGRAVDALRDACHRDLADELEELLVGRNVIHRRWTFQIVEGYDDGDYATFRRWERQARVSLVDGRRTPPTDVQTVRLQ